MSIEILKELLEKNGLDINRLVVDTHIKCGEYSLTYYQTNGFDAQQVWLKFRLLQEQTGLHPFIVMDEFYYQTRVNPKEIEKVIKTAEKIDGKKWLQKKLNKEGTLEEINTEHNIEYQKQVEKMTKEIEEAEKEEKETKAFIKEVLTEKMTPLETFRIPFRDDRVGHKEAITIFLFPAKKPWQTLAYLDIGSHQDIYNFANEEEHLAVMKYWYEKFQAEPAGLYSGELEFFVANPPNGYDDALALAFEHYAYCQDSLKYSNLGSFDLFAKLLIDSTVWYFRWRELIDKL